MKYLFRNGDTKTFQKKVTPADCAVFFDEMVHPLYATFALARDAEWCCRLFVLDMKADDEEGIGTFIEVTHLSAARINEVVHFTATVESIRHHEIICSFTARTADKLIATGRQGQKILPETKLRELYGSGNNKK